MIDHFVEAREACEAVEPTLPGPGKDLRYWKVGGSSSNSLNARVVDRNPPQVGDIVVSQSDTVVVLRITGSGVESHEIAAYPAPPTTSRSMSTQTLSFIATAGIGEGEVSFFECAGFTSSYI